MGRALLPASNTSSHNKAGFIVHPKPHGFPTSQSIQIPTPNKQGGQFKHFSPRQLYIIMCCRLIIVVLAGCFLGSLGFCHLQIIFGAH